MTPETLTALLAELKRVTKEWCHRNCSFFGAENHQEDCLHRKALIRIAEEELEHG